MGLQDLKHARGRLCIAREVFLALSLLIVIAPIGVAATVGKTVYSQTSNKELKRKAFQLVTNIKEVLSSYNKKDRDILAEYDEKSRPGSTAAAGKALRDQWVRETDDLHESTMRRYKEQYWSDAILLANEILQRLPKQKRQPSVLPLYQHPTNVLGVQAVAEHLELIAKSLPD